MKRDFLVQFAKGYDEGVVVVADIIEPGQPGYDPGPDRDWLYVALDEARTLDAVQGRHIMPLASYFLHTVSNHWSYDSHLISRC